MQMISNKAEEIADYMISLYTQFGDEDYIGEPVSQLEHMCQCALLAESEGESEEVILAGFFHDLGHFCEHLQPVQQMDGFGVVDHEGLGAAMLLEKGFSPNIASLVRNHVEAKRYLTFRYPEYYARLSDASKETLRFQGGRMTAEEAAAFENDPLFELHIRLRQWDEKAKLENQPLPPLEKFKGMMIRHLQSRGIA
jgi:phosphonate degradation associated HDIG domain protein